MQRSVNWLLGSLALVGAAMLGNLVPRLHQPDDGIARELASQRSLLSSVAKTVESIQSVPTAPPTTIVASSCDAATVQAHIETSVRQALAEDRKQVAEEAKDQGVSPDNAQIYAKAEQWIDAKIQSKRWTSTDAAELTRASVGLSPEQRTALRVRVVRALNSGELSDPRFE